MSASLDTAYLREWIGREEVVGDVLTPALSERYHATLGLSGDAATYGQAAPRLIHFCLCQPAAPMRALGEDGHPSRGGFLPPVPLPRRMWAGSDISFSGDLLVGDTVTRRSRVANVVVKEGRTGTLCFVTVDHEISGSIGVVVRDRQTIVYRGLDAGGPAKVAEAADTGLSSIVVNPSAPLLFRYSALTFNGHRIHYDQPYATLVEGYPGLVVHGPLQATLLLHLAAVTNGGRAPDRFEFKSVSTLFDTEDFNLHAGLLADGELSLWTAKAGGPVAMQAKAHWS